MYLRAREVIRSSLTIHPASKPLGVSHVPGTLNLTTAVPALEELVA